MPVCLNNFKLIFPVAVFNFTKIRVFLISFGVC